MSFNEMDILLFQRFFSLKTDSKLVLDMIQINFNKKIDNANDNKIINNKFDLAYIIQNYLLYQIKGKVLLNKKFSISIDNEAYSKLINSYDTFYNDLLNKNAFNKTPYCYFLNNQNDNNKTLNSAISSKKSSNILTDKNKVEFFLHVILNYAYYIIFVHKNKNFKNQHNLMPIIFSKTKKDLSSLYDQESTNTSNDKYKKFFINYIANFFIKYHKKYPLIIEALNQTSVETLIHILVEYYSINNITNFYKFLFIFKNNTQKVFRTLLLFNDKNSNIKKYKQFTNNLLCCFLTKSINNILFIIKSFNIKGMDEKTSLKIFLDMYTKNKLANDHKGIKNLFLFLIEIILNCIKIKNKILTLFMIKALDEISLSYSFESDLNNVYIFQSFTSAFLQKFGIKINFEELKFNYISENEIKHNNNWCTYIGKRMNDYLYLLSTNFQIITKRSFEHVCNSFDKGFVYLFDILNLLTTESQFYYINIENKDVQNYRKNILIYISDLFGYLDRNKLSKEIFKYYFKPNYFWLKKYLKYNISYLNEKPSIKIEISKKLNFFNLCNYLASDEYQTKVLNSIQNIFTTVSPFNSLEIQCSLLENYLDELNEQNDINEKENITNNIIKEKVIELPKDLILSVEDEVELKKYLDKISINSIKYKEKIIYIILENLSKETNDKEELTLKSNPTKIIYLIIKILSSESIVDNNDILINCIDCVCALHKIGKLFFEYEEEIKYISLLQEIKNKKGNELQSDLEEKISELLTELLTNVKNKEDENNKNKIINDEQKKEIKISEEDKIIIDLINNCKKIEMKRDKFELSFMLKKMYNELDTSPNTNKARKISMDTIQLVINYLNNLLLTKCFDEAFMTQNVLKVYRNLFLSIKSDETLRKFYLKIVGENLFSLLNKKKYISEKEKATKIEASSKIFELFMKIIKKLKYKSFLIGKDILKILFEVFENQQKGIYSLTPYSIVSCISICAYLVEYCHEEIMLYISIIIRTGINFLKSTKSSTIEQQRSSAFLLYKVLDVLSDQELDTYSKEIFDACNIAQTYSNDKALLFYLNKCLNYYS